MDPIPDRQTFIRTVRHVIYDDLYVKLQYKNTEFYKIIDSCVRLMYKEGMHEGQEAWLSIKKDWTLDDIMEIYTKLISLTTLGAGLDVSQYHAVENLKEYMRQYILSQKIHTSNKSIPRDYTETSEENFIQDTIDFLGQLYNDTDKRTQFSKSLEEYVKLFWKYDRTWKRVQTSATVEDISNLQKKLLTITRQDADFYSYQKLENIIRYITDWFYFNKKPAVTQKSAPDLQARVEELEEKFEELQLQVRELLRERPPPLTRQVLIQQLARCL